MCRGFAIAVGGVGLAGLLGGCSSFSMGTITDYFKSAPSPIQVQIESTPPGADAKTSLGPGCKTPCSVSLSPQDSTSTFTVTYTLDRFQQATVPVNVTQNPGDFTNPATAKIDPNPVFAELQQAVPSKGSKPKAVKRKKPVATEAVSPSLEPNAAAPVGTGR